MAQRRGASQSAKSRSVEPHSVSDTIASGDPFSVLGPHEVSPGLWEVRAILPSAETASVVSRDGETVLADMEKRQVEGFFVGTFQCAERPDYRLRIEWQGGVEIRHDPYSFGTFLSHDDLMRLRDPGSDAVYT